MFQDLGHALGKIFGLAARPFGGIPQFEMAAHSQKHDIAGQAGCIAQLRRDQDAARAVHIHILGIAEQQALQGTGRHGELGYLLAFFFPCVAGVHKQTAIGMAREGQATFDLGNERVTVPGRDRDPPFGIQRESTATLEQNSSPLFYTKTYFSPLYGMECNRSSASLQFFQLQQVLSAACESGVKKICSEIKKLAKYLQVLCHEMRKDCPEGFAITDTSRGRKQE